MSELSLAHISSDQTRAAYAGDELLEQRAALMRDWGKFLAQIRGEFAELIARDY